MSLEATPRIGVTTAALALFAVSAMSTATAGDSSARWYRAHHAHHAVYREHSTHQLRISADGERLPYAPEYGFLHHVPPNAIRGPGYTFVPGKGILGASCDLPSSACSNEYRDVR